MGHAGSDSGTASTARWYERPQGKPPKLLLNVIANAKGFGFHAQAQTGAYNSCFTLWLRKSHPYKHLSPYFRDV